MRVSICSFRQLWSLGAKALRSLNLLRQLSASASVGICFFSAHRIRCFLDQIWYGVGTILKPFDLHDPRACRVSWEGLSMKVFDGTRQFQDSKIKNQPNPNGSLNKTTWNVLEVQKELNKHCVYRYLQYRTFVWFWVATGPISTYLRPAAKLCGSSPSTDRNSSHWKGDRPKSPMPCSSWVRGTMMRFGFFLLMDLNGVIMDYQLGFNGDIIVHGSMIIMVGQQ